MPGLRTRQPLPTEYELLDSDVTGKLDLAGQTDSFGIIVIGTLSHSLQHPLFLQPRDGW
ncbi:hypothetical protein TVC13_00580 [Arthrobacter sp. 3Tela_A]